MCSIRNCLFFITFICIIAVGSADQYKIVDTDNGKIRGIKSSTLLKGVPYYAFKGIPYAKPPIGDLRFKAPEPSDPWKPTILNAFQYSKICVQPSLMIPHPLLKSEDCLTLNVFVPGNAKPDSRLAVLFFIHGGGFLEGAGDDFTFGPDFIVEKETILVTINYRLGVLGFLSLNSTEYSGNMGLKDQQLALKWVHSNIHSFGGDNKRITIFGHSAGGVSINYHILSAESRRYFRNAIPMSGSVHNLWALEPEKDYLQSAFEMAKQLGKPQNSYDELVASLKTIPSESFNRFCVLGFKNTIQAYSPFGPVLERSDAKQPFLINLPEELYKSSEIGINTMFVATSHEMVSFVSILPASTMKELDTNFQISLPFIEPKLPFDSKEHQSLTKKVREFYFGNRVINEQESLQLFHLMSDLNFAWGISKSVKYSTKYSMGKTFYLLFSVASKLNVWTNLTLFKRDDTSIQPGASHSDALCYIFRCNKKLSIYDEILSNKDDYQAKISIQTINYITELYTNFAKYDNPSYGNELSDEFQPIESDQMHYISLSNDGLKAQVNPHKETLDFWTNLEEKANQMYKNMQTKAREEL